jgi:predicted nucleic acid-binding protein
MVAFDNTILSLLIFPDAELQQGIEGKAVEYARDRVIGLVEKLEATREQVIVPTPALAELMVTPEADIQEILTTLRGSSFIRIEGFDERAAVELAVRLREARKAGDQKEGLAITKTAMKFDRQIVAIALVNGATTLYSDDIAVAKFAQTCGLAVKAVTDLPVPAAQDSFSFESADKQPSDVEISTDPSGSQPKIRLIDRDEFKSE